MAVREILLLGDPRLYERSAPVDREEMDLIRAVVQDLHDALMDYRSKYGAGRAIAAPRIGVFKAAQYQKKEVNIIYDQCGKEWFQGNCMLGGRQRFSKQLTNLHGLV